MSFYVHCVHIGIMEGLPSPQGDTGSMCTVWWILYQGYHHQNEDRVHNQDTDFHHPKASLCPLQSYPPLPRATPGLLSLSPWWGTSSSFLILSIIEPYSAVWTELYFVYPCACRWKFRLFPAWDLTEAPMSFCIYLWWTCFHFPWVTAGKSMLNLTGDRRTLFQGGWTMYENSSCSTLLSILETVKL